MVDFVQKDSYDINDLIGIIKILRSENGCPWDMEQTHKSIKSDFIEEVFEAVEAIDLEDTELLKEELGDVLLQVAFHCQIETENNNFGFDDICDGICKKMIIRHPHVFGNVTVSGTGEVLKNWDNIKQQTKGQDTYAETLESVAKSLPALMRAQKVGKRAARAGMDFKSAEDSMKCMDGEITELYDALHNGTQAEIEEELGDVLFSCVNTARLLGIDAEQALTAAVNKFIKRFTETERLTRLNGIDDMKSLGIDELDVYWQKAKESLD
ncbi:MAG: nucleoside triphosphate pyrophosphohydrolase [Oscillospiraceae bacterium]